MHCATSSETVLLGWGDNENYKLGIFRKELLHKKVLEPIIIPFSNNFKIDTVMGGENYMFALTTEKSLLSWGANDFGQLGIGEFSDVLNEVKLVPFFEYKKNIKMVHTTYFHCMALTEDGLLFGWGKNDDGQLGIGNNENQHTPTLVNVRRIRDVQTGYSHTFLIAEDGLLFAFGRNLEFQLGVDSQRYIPRCNTPQQVTSLAHEQVTDVVCGGHFSAALTASKCVYVWGDNSDAQLGLGDCKTRRSPTKQTFFENHGLVPKRIHAGYNYMFTITEDNRFYSWGNNDHGRLGAGVQQYLVLSPIEVKPLAGMPVRRLSTNTNHSVLVTEENMCYSWGDGSHGQLGVGSKKTLRAPGFIKTLQYFEVSMVVAVTDSSFAVARRWAGWPHTIYELRHRYGDVFVQTENSTATSSQAHATGCHKRLFSEMKLQC